MTVTTPSAQDGALKTAVADAVAAALEESPHIKALQGVLGVEVERIGPLAVRIRVRANHPSPRGQKFHYYVVRVSEPQ